MSDGRALDIDLPTTALVLVDLQNFTVAAPTVPLSGREVLANAIRLAESCRAHGVPVVLIRVDSGADGALLLKPPADVPMPSFDLPNGALDLAPELGPKARDVVVTKHNWGAFHGTDLDIQLRRRGIRTLVVGGIATNFGVESTVRQAHERGYAQIIVSDAVAAFSPAEHEHPLLTTMPRIARIRRTVEVLEALRDAAARSARAPHP